jgi:hypothetical protein
MEGGRQQLLAQLVSGEYSPRTRGRLETLYRTLGQHQTRVTEALREGGLEGRARTGPRPIATVPGEESILAYYTQIHRDWGWDGTTNTEAADATSTVSEIIDDVRLGALLVLGAGACRLTRDLHRRHGATTTLALDLNPLPYLVARKLLNGSAVQLFEFPPWPKSSELCFAERTLPGCVESDDSLGLVFADGLNPPLRPESVDSVLTPWFIDQIPRDMTTLFAKIWSLLKPGGYWFNFGPLIYPSEHTALAHRYCVDEVLEFVEREGFALEISRYEPMPYLASPISGQGRLETVLSFRARKREPRRVQQDTSWPEWLEREDRPVPRFTGLARYDAPHAMFLAIIDLIDGERTIAQIAHSLVVNHALPKEAAVPGVKACLREMFRTTQASPRPPLPRARG